MADRIDTLPDPDTSANRAPATWRACATWIAATLALVLAADRLGGGALTWAASRERSGQSAGRLVAAREARADVLILGSSRALEAYDDAALTRELGLPTWNAACQARGLLYERGALALIAREHPPRLVVLDVAWFPQERERAAVLAPWIDYSDVVRSILAPGWRERVLLASRLFRHDGRALAIVANLRRKPLTTGFDPRDGVMAPSPLRERDPLRKPVALEPGYEDALAATVRDARSIGARVVFLESPSWGSPFPDAVMRAWDDVAAREGVPFLRLRPQEHPELRDPSLFVDPAHLNRKGAVVATALLAGELRRQLSADAER